MSKRGKSKEAKPRRLGPFLKNAREAAGLRQRDVSEALGYHSAQFISDWERGLRSPPAKKLKQLVQMYGISVEDFFDILLEERIHQLAKELKADLGIA